MGKRIAIVGSREYSDLEHVRQIVQHLPEDVTIISGGARGVDRTAADEARRRGLRVVEYLPEWNLYGAAAGPIRNSIIIEDCDEVYAFWDGESRGTLDSITKAKKLGKPVTIFLLKRKEEDD